MAALIMLCAAMALRSALARDFKTHRRWALRLYLVVSASLFIRAVLFLSLFLNRGWRRADVLSRGNSLGDCQAPRRQDGHSRLGCASGGMGARYLGRDLRGRGREQLNRGERWNPCENVLFPWLRRSAFCRGGRSYAWARRCFWRAAYSAASVADMLCAVYRLFLLVFGTATTVPGVIAQDGDSFSAGCPAADLDDFLAGSRVVHECVQKDFVTKAEFLGTGLGSPSKPCLLAERRSGGGPR